MDRAEFLILCQKVSVMKHNKKTISPELLVKYDNIKYYPIGYTLTFENAKPRHTAILHDLKAHTVINASLEKVYKEV